MDPKIKGLKVVTSSQLMEAYANAFRVLPDTGNEYFLDFLFFFPATQTARVICRMRVHREFLKTIRDSLDDVLAEVLQPGLSVVESPSRIDPEMLH